MFRVYLCIYASTFHWHISMEHGDVDGHFLFLAHRIIISNRSMLSGEREREREREREKRREERERERERERREEKRESVYIYIYVRVCMYVITRGLMGNGGCLTLEHERNSIFL